MSNPSIRFGQIFYGRSRDGYGILGTSPSGRPFADAVAAFCRAVGSPDRPGDIRPFLLSKRNRGSVLMVSACRDEDSTGRATLFFHALVAPEGELVAAGVDAFVLSDRKAFVSSLPSGEVEDLRFSGSGKRSFVPRSADVNLPAFIASDHPLDAEVRRILGSETLTLNWSTYSYNPLPGFDLCVCSSYAVAPAGENRYTFDGGRFRPLANVAAPAVQPNGTSSTANRPLSPMLKVSLFANAILVAALVGVLAMRGGTPRGGTPSEKPVEPVSTPVDSKLGSPKSDPPVEMTESEAKRTWNLKTENEWRKTSRAAFERKLGDKTRITNFKNSMKTISPYYPLYEKNSPGLADNVKETFAVFEAYISFVDDEILKPQSSN